MSAADAMATRARILFRDGLAEGGCWHSRTAADNLARFFAWRHWHRLEARRVWTFTAEGVLVATGGGVVKLLTPAQVAEFPPEGGFSRPRGMGWIYFIQAGLSGPVKIGWTDNVGRRLRVLATGHYETLHVIACCAGTMRDERRLHTRFRHSRIRGEWFRASATLLEFARTTGNDRAAQGR